MGSGQLMMTMRPSRDQTFSLSVGHSTFIEVLKYSCLDFLSTRRWRTLISMLGSQIMDCLVLETSVLSKFRSKYVRKSQIRRKQIEMQHLSQILYRTTTNSWHLLVRLTMLSHRSQYHYSVFRTEQTGPSSQINNKCPQGLMQTQMLKWMSRPR